MKHSHHELYHQDIDMEEVEDRVFASVTQVHTGSGDNIAGDKVVGGSSSNCGGGYSGGCGDYSGDGDCCDD